MERPHNWTYVVGLLVASSIVANDMREYAKRNRLVGVSLQERLKFALSSSLA